jgi:serine phosphatase RsbU (regulator of sigma subunit)
MKLKKEVVDIIVNFINNNKIIPSQLRSNIINTIYNQSAILKGIENIAKKFEGESNPINKLIKTLSISRIQNENAKNLQSWIFPTNIPRNKSISVHVDLIPMSGTSGDFYDIVEMIPGSNVYGVFLADVSGHGVSAALTTVIVKLLLNKAINMFFHPKDIITYLNNEICNLTRNKSYLTAVFIVIDFRNHEILYTSAGHPYCFRYNQQNQHIQELDTKGGTVIGFVKSLQYPEYKIKPYQGDKIVIYTDGITEAKSPSGEMFGIDRFYKLIERHINAPSEELIQIIENELRHFCEKDKFNDDISIIIIDIKEAQISDTSSISKKVYLTKEESTRLIEYYKKSMASKEAEDDIVGMAKDLKNLSFYLLTKEKYNESRTYLNKLESIIDKVNDPALIGNVYHTMSLYYKKTGKDLEKYKDYNLKALKQYKKVDDKPGIITIYISLSIYYGMTGDIEKARDYSYSSLELLKNRESTMVTRSDMATVYNNLGVSYYLEKDIEKGLDYFQKCLELCEQDNVMDLQCVLLSNMAELFIIRCDYDKAFNYLSKTLTILEDFDDTFTLVIVYSNMSRILFKKGEYEITIYYITKALRIAEEHNLIDNVLNLLPFRAYMFMLKNHINKAFDDINSSLSRINQTKDKKVNRLIYVSIAKSILSSIENRLTDKEYETLYEIMKSFDNNENPEWYFEKAIEGDFIGQSFSEAYFISYCEYAVYLARKKEKDKAESLLKECLVTASQEQNLCAKQDIEKTQQYLSSL